MFGQRSLAALEYGVSPLSRANYSHTPTPYHP